MSIVGAIVALCLVIIIHEAGHYWAAVWTGMKVDRFSVFGIGPTVLKLGTWRGTEFVISAIPFGAFVLIRGMEPGDDDDPRMAADAVDDDAWAKAIGAAKGAPAAKVVSPNFRDKPLWARAAVLAGGPLANYITAIFLFFAVFMMSGVPGPVSRIEVTAVTPDKPAAMAGLEVGDRLVAIGETPIDPAAGVEPVIDVLVAHPEQALEVTLVRGDETLVKTVETSAEGKIGAGLAPAGDRAAVGVGQASVLAFQAPFKLTASQLVGLYKLITGQLDAQVQGPVGIVKGIASSIDRGLIPFITMAAMISTLLGMFNLLPLPALDGGRLTFLGYEALARRRARAHIEEMVHGYGMLALLLLIGVVTLRDVGLFDKVRSLFGG